MSDKITLDRETFKVLAADTRVDILKKLGEHKLTLTDLAGEMDMSPSTIKEHLDRLVDAGLIEADERGMKWKYYRLTGKGRNIVTPQETKVWILLGTTVLVLAGSALSLAGKLTGLMAPAMSKTALNAPAPAGAEMAEAAFDKAVSTTATTLAQGAGASTTTTLGQVPAALMSYVPPAVNGTVSGAANAGGAVVDGAAKMLGGVREDEMLMSAYRSFNDSAVMLKGEGGLAAASRAADDVVNGTLCFVSSSTSTTVSAVNEAVRKVAASSSTTTTLLVRAKESASDALQAAAGYGGGAAQVQVPYLEIALIGVSIVVAILCIAYLARNRLRIV